MFQRILLGVGFVISGPRLGHDRVGTAYDLTVDQFHTYW
jgi:hypothetical protein